MPSESNKKKKGRIIHYQTNISSSVDISVLACYDTIYTQDEISIADGKDSFPLVMVGGVLEENESWDIGKEVIDSITKIYTGAHPVRPKVCHFELMTTISVNLCSSC